MQDLVYVFYSLVIGILSFLLGYSIRKSTVKKLTSLLPKRKSSGAVFKPQSQEEIKKAQAKKFYENL